MTGPQAAIAFSIDSLKLGGAERTLLRWAGDGASPNTQLVKLPSLQGKVRQLGAFVEEGAGHDVNDFPLPL